MSDFIRLSRLAQDLKSCEVSGSGVRDSAAKTAIALVGERAAIDEPALVNCAALAISMPRIESTEITRGVCHLIDETDMHDLPDAPPSFLTRPRIIETRDETYSLFADVASLGIYDLDGMTFIVMLAYSGAAIVEKVRDPWGKKISKLRYDDARAQNEKIRRDYMTEALRFLTVLSVLLEAERTPVEVGKVFEKKKEKRKAEALGIQKPLVERVYLSKRYENAGSSTGSSAIEASGNIKGRISADVTVRGHLKRQRYGEGSALTKWIYVDAFESRRWIKPAPRKTIVSI